MNEIRLLGKDDIEIRVAQTNVKGDNVKVSLLLYKNARVDMKILDELYGPFHWKRTHKLLGDRLYCVVSVMDPDTHEWVEKEDVGVESNTEAEKGQASDSFKRACVNWGIGRELYTAPRISVELSNDEFTKTQQGNVKVWASFSVSEIEYNETDRSITKLVIVDRFGKTRFQYAAGKTESTPAPAKKSTQKKAEKPAPAPEVAAPAPAPEAPAETEADPVHLKWVKALALHSENKNGVTAEAAYKEKFKPSKDEWRSLMDEVFRYQLANGISDNN